MFPYEMIVELEKTLIKISRRNVSWDYCFAKIRIAINQIIMNNRT